MVGIIKFDKYITYQEAIGVLDNAGKPLVICSAWLPFTLPDGPDLTCEYGLELGPNCIGCPVLTGESNIPSSSDSSTRRK